MKVSENLLTVRKGTAMKVWGAVLITNKRYGYGEGEFDGCAQTCRGRFVPVLKRVSGRRERRDTYAVRLRLMMAGVPDDAGSREVWRILEDDAAALYGAVRACERVRSVRGLKVSPETKPLTPRGETAVAAEFEAEMFYCD